MEKKSAPCFTWGVGIVLHERAEDSSSTQVERERDKHTGTQTHIHTNTQTETHIAPPPKKREQARTYLVPNNVSSKANEQILFREQNSISSKSKK